MATASFTTSKIVSVAFTLTDQSGCRVYPVILDEEIGIILDTICHSRKSITKTEKKLKGKRVIKLLEIIDSEALERCT